MTTFDIGSTTTSAKRVFKKTQLCSFWVRGACKRGTTCAFAHGESQLRETPNLSKTKICKMYQTDQCSLGELCTFAHSREELRSLRPKRASSSNILIEVPKGAKDVLHGTWQTHEAKSKVTAAAIVEFESVPGVVGKLLEAETLPLTEMIFKL
mmetsp:Transcript_46456/g.86854  ORF Transcript_46456/g.86854 Transcript_46456/m.86854 type:complete len:153 (-) Transcript_46456:107-565(-)